MQRWGTVTPRRTTLSSGMHHHPDLCASGGTTSTHCRHPLFGVWRFIGLGGVVWWCTEYVDGCDVLAGGGGSCTRGVDGYCGDELCVPHAFLLSAPLPFCVRSTSPDWHGVRAAAATDLVDELGYGRGCTGGIDRREGQSDGSKDQREGHRERRNKRSCGRSTARKLLGHTPEK